MHESKTGLFVPTVLLSMQYDYYWLSHLVYVWLIMVSDHYMIFQGWGLPFDVDWGAYHCWSGHQLEITSFLQNCTVVYIYIFFNPNCIWNCRGCLSWSSFSFHSDGTFYLWETNTWTSEPWSSTSGFVTVNKNDIC